MEPRLRALYRDAGGRALATLLEVGGCAVLLDCGWAAAAPAPGAGAGAPAEAAGLDPALLAPLAAVAPRLDCVLVSHADLAHLGALPYAVGRLGVTCPILGTLPCSNMGQMCMYDDFLSRQGAEDFDTYNLDDVDRAFSRFETLQFNQRRVLDPGREGASKITVTAHVAGHSLGGAVWGISVGGEDIIYASDFNHSRDRHLEGAALAKLFDRPALAIVGSQFERLPRAPVTRTGAVLELVLVLEGHWLREGLGGYPLALLTHVGFNTMEFAKSQLEWMNPALTANFEQTRTNAFQTRFLKICHERRELDSLPRGPKVVLASMASLDAGPARGLVSEWASNG